MSANKKKPFLLIIASILMLLFGAIRGIGGIFLLLQGKGAFPDIKTDGTMFVYLSLGLIIIGAFEIISAFGVYHLKRKYWYLGIIVTLFVVIDSAINGHFFFGKPGEGGTLANLVVATVIIAFLFLGRNSLINKK